MSSKHSRGASFVPEGPLRWTLAAVGLWSFLVTAMEAAPRYQRVVDLALAVIVAAAGVTPAAYRPQARTFVRRVATVLLALAGVVAGVSIVEAMTLAAAAVVAGALSCFFTGLPRRPSHSAAGA
jgi:hypothetical protein